MVHQKQMSRPQISSKNILRIPFLPIQHTTLHFIERFPSAIMHLFLSALVGVARCVCADNVSRYISIYNTVRFNSPQANLYSVEEWPHYMHVGTQSTHQLHSAYASHLLCCCRISVESIAFANHVKFCHFATVHSFASFRFLFSFHFFFSRSDVTSPDT